MSQQSLFSSLLFVGAIPIWLFLIVTIPKSSAWGASTGRFLIAPIVLVGITIAIHWLLRDHRNAWAISTLLAAVIALGSISLAVLMAG